MYIYGYRIGLLISGAFSLILSDKVSWNLVYYFIASTMFVGIITTLIADEFIDKNKQKNFNIISWFKSCVINPFQDFIQKPRWFIIILFILSFKLTDAFAGNLFLPFLLEIDFTKTQIATIVKTFGLFATLFGALIGGIFVKKFGLMKSLWLAAFLQIFSNFGFYFLAKIGNNVDFLYGVIFIENLSGGIGDVVFVAYLSSLCNIKFSATQYSLLVSIASITRSFLSSPAGVFAQNFGWSNFFLLSIFLGIPVLILLFILSRNNKGRILMRS
jgi:PAT family beta-lactamase induction signal transducer AmpG